MSMGKVTRRVAEPGGYKQPSYEIAFRPEKEI